MHSDYKTNLKLFLYSHSVNLSCTVTRFYQIGIVLSLQNMRSININNKLSYHLQEMHAVAFGSVLNQHRLKAFLKVFLNENVRKRPRISEEYLVRIV
jgi:hypothetical protein